MSEYEDEYIKTLNQMDVHTLAKYMTTYIEKARELQKGLESVISEIVLMHKILIEKLLSNPPSKG